MIIRMNQTPYAYEKKIEKKLPYTGGDLIRVWLILRNLYVARHQVRQTMHLTSFLLTIFLIGIGMCNNTMANQYMENHLEPQEGILLPPMGSDEEISGEHEEIPEFAPTLPTPYQLGYHTFTATQAAKVIAAINLKWSAFVTLAKSGPEIYKEAVLPAALCQVTPNLQAPYLSQWIITCIRDKQRYVLNLILGKNGQEWYIKTEDKMIPCVITKGNVQNGASNILPYGFYYMQDWFHACEDGRVLLFIGYEINHWYAYLYFSFSTNDNKLYYHGSEYLSAETAASI